MGGGSYSTNRAKTRSQTQNYKSKSVDQIFRSKSIDSAMNPKGIDIRESRDSEEHPKSLSIIMGLDVTGSMGKIPHHLIAEGLTTTMGAILERNIQDPQVLFMGIGDHYTDRAPLQVAQFESSDPLLDKWLKDVWLEGGGGGNGGESYLLAWYFAAHHTVTDCYQKRGEKGYLFTIGDEKVHKRIRRENLQQIMGNSTQIEKDATSAQELLEEAKKMYKVHHLHLTSTSNGMLRDVQGDWKELMGENVHFIEEPDNIPKKMAEIMIQDRTDENITADEIDEVAEQIENSNDEEVIL